MEDIVGRLKRYLELKGISVSVAEKTIGISNASLSKPFNSKASIKTETLENFLKTYSDISPEWLLSGTGEMLKEGILISNMLREGNAEYGLELLPEIKHGVPYYDVEFTSSFLEVENSQTIQPTSYINHPFFAGCDMVVRNSGQSMAKLICHGDAVGLVRINNWQDFFPLGEVYAIVTENNFRMIKIITKGIDEDHYTLISKPTDSKKDEFPPQQIRKTSIVGIFKVQACSHLF